MTEGIDVGKKKLLFVMESLRMGGAEKSLLTLLSELDYSRFDVSLFLFYHDGELMHDLPSAVNLLPEDPCFRVFSSNRKAASLNYLRQGDVARTWYSFCYLIGCVWQRITRRKLYIGWNYVHNLFDDQMLSADVAIAYLERKSVYYVAEKVVSPRKIAFIHNNYDIYPYDKKLDSRYFPCFQAIAAVSEHCCQVLKRRFPALSSRFIVIKNQIPAPTIRSKAQQPLSQQKRTPGELVLVTVGRLVGQKGYDRAIKICKLLVDQKVLLKWYAIGDGPEKADLQEQVHHLGLERNFILAGSFANPYSWMQFADVYVQPSRFEGCSTTVAEAKVLNKKIVCSDIPEFREQLQDYPNAWLAASEEDFAQTIRAAAEASLQPAVTTEDTLEAFYRCVE